MIAAPQITLPKDHPHAARILELARQLGDSAEAGAFPIERAELHDLLREVGLPENVIDAPSLDPVPAAGEVMLRTTEPPGSVWCSYGVLGARGEETRPGIPSVVAPMGWTDIMLIDGVLAPEFCSALIDAAEAADLWAQGTQVSGSGDAYASEGRTSHNVQISRSKHRFFGRWEDMLAALMADAALFYKRWNKHASPNRQDGWEIMRYEPGQAFGMHVDSIAGNDRWGQRQLSALLYLNDGYKGGATVFPRQGVSLEPTAGTLALFPPGSTHPHEAEPPTEGTKYAVVGWFYP